MLAVEVMHSDWPGPRRFTFHRPIWIGASTEAELIIAGPGIRKQHVHAAAFGRQVSLSGDEDTYGNGVSMSVNKVVDKNDLVRVGAYALRFESVVAIPVEDHPGFVASGPVEQALLDARAQTSQLA